MSDKKDKNNLDGKTIGFVEAEFADIRNSSVRSVESGHADLRQVGALSVDGDWIDVSQGAIGLMKGHRIHVEKSISAVNASDRSFVNLSMVPVSVSREHAEIKNSAVGIMAGQEIRSEGSSAVFMLARNVNGDVKTLFDLRSALGFGAIIGGIIGLITLLRR